MTDPTTEQTAENDGPMLLPNGLIRIHTTVGEPPQTFERMLRRPTMGQLRYLRELLHEKQDRLIALSEEAEALRFAAPAEPETSTPENDAAYREAAAAHRAQVRGSERRLVRASEDTYREWITEAVELLSGQPVEIPDDDLPPWWFTVDTVVAMLTHWRTVPPARGVR